MSDPKINRQDLENLMTMLDNPHRQPIFYLTQQDVEMFEKQGIPLEKIPHIITNPASKAFSEGQGFAEYALVIILVAVIVILIAVALGPQVGNLFSNVTSAI